FSLLMIFVSIDAIWTGMDGSYMASLRGLWLVSPSEPEVPAGTAPACCRAGIGRVHVAEPERDIGGRSRAAGCRPGREAAAGSGPEQRDANRTGSASPHQVPRPGTGQGAQAGVLRRHRGTVPPSGQLRRS